jgi:hypothetical protein
MAEPYSNEEIWSSLSAEEIEEQRIIKAGIVRRYRQFCADWAADQATIERHQSAIQACQAHQQELAAKALDCEAAARAFGFNLVTAMAALVEQAQSQTQAPLDVPQPPVAPPPIPPRGSKGPTIKELVLEIAQQAYPKPIRASDVRRQLANRGFSAHDKTVGMTLYRWLRSGELRRDNWDWYYVPPNDGASTPQSNDGAADASATLFH